jgi:starch synthase (maltosyl-transferring)
MPVVQAPRIYNLFPLLAGPMDAWAEHLPRIAAMQFDWLYLNPFHYPGSSGSLYAIQDFDRLHPVVAGGADGPWDARLAAFCAAARDHDIRVMLDLVVNHAARDARLVDEHPDWFRRHSDGDLVRPGALDPTQPRGVVTWGDLAAIDYGRPELREGQIAYWTALVRRYLACGVSGFRCDAAYQVPVEFWRPLIGAARETEPSTVFAAETLGCAPEQSAALAPAGFDLMFNSSKWWDFREPWLLEQYERLRTVAPSVAFPESHDTPRLATEFDAVDAGQLEARYAFQYGWAAFFSAGVMMPMGYEYGFPQALDVKDARPGQWATQLASAPFNLDKRIAAINRLKAKAGVFGREAPQRRLTGPHAQLVVLHRQDDDADAVVILNPDFERPARLDPGVVAQATGHAAWRDATPGRKAATVRLDEAIELPPATLRVWLQVFQAPRRPRPRRRTAQLERLEALAAHRIAVEGVVPEIDGGRFPVKRVLGERVAVEADVFSDGHDVIRAAVQYRPEGSRAWREAPLTRGDNDRWSGSFTLDRLGRFEYTIVAWRDLFRTWRDEVVKKVDAGQDVALELVEGTALVADAATSAEGTDGAILQREAEVLQAAVSSPGDCFSRLMAEELLARMDRAGPRTHLSRYEKVLEVVVDRPAAAFAAWYEMFPRSQSDEPGQHGTFRDVIRRLPYVRDLGFDVLYFTPIHPIGRTHRKGRNNTLNAGPDDPGSVYAIGAEEGGHTEIHPELGTLEDFRTLVDAAHAHGLEIALDIAVQCSPDHPWLREHPEWFDWRPDGTIKYAENPPKKYQDIVNVHFYRDAIPALWFEMKRVFEFWIEQGVRSFRVDNPHTKPFPFWEWCIGEIKAAHPDVVFLSEAFTRPKVMLRLAKLGFTQSYTYFTWRNSKAGMAAYLEELARGDAREVFRPNFFVNTPDINPPVLHGNERPAFEMRLVLAATLSGLYGLYNGYEICEGTPLPGKEEYLDSEKYEIRRWDLDRPGNIQPLIRRLNAIRRENPALRTHTNVRFLNAWNEHLLYYFKATPERDNCLLVMVNMDHQNAQEADFEVPLWEFGLPDDASIEVEDLLEGQSFTWHGKMQHIRMDPAHSPARIWRLRPPGAARRR